VERQKAEAVIKQNILYRKIILALSASVLVIAVLLLIFGIKYGKTKRSLKSVTAEKAAAEQSLSERESSFADEKSSMSGEISKLNEQISMKKEQEIKSGGEKTVYLTFDDGPSPNTPRIIDILNENGVRATFFVKNGDKYNGYMKNITESGNKIALHSYTHDYSKIYVSEEAFFDDLQKISDLVYDETGVRTNIIRFPGGGSNTISRKYSVGIMSNLTKDVKEKGYYYFDWNVSSGDASAKELPKERIIENCQKVPKSNTVVVLLHDSSTKNTTVDALPDIIAYYKSMGYGFDVLSEKTYPIHQKVNN